MCTCIDSLITSENSAESNLESLECYENVSYSIPGWGKGLGLFEKIKVQKVTF